MNQFNDLSDDEFIPFLHSLGVETYKKSFEWMFHDPDFAHVLKWLYRNLDHNNALNAREECRYEELNKKNCLLTPDELEASILALQHEFEGLCMPGDQESMDDVKLDITMKNERLNMLDKHEKIVKDLIKQNHLIKEELDIKLTKLRGTEQQCAEEETALSDECLTLAEEVETVEDSVCDIIADNLKSCTNTDKEFDSKFFVFGPFESYRQSQAHFTSLFDLYVSKKFDNKHTVKSTNQDMQTVLSEAKAMEERLSDAVSSYITTTAELCGVQSQMRLVSSYNNIHPGQVSSCLLEAQSAINILHQEESVLDHQILDAVRHFVAERTNLAVQTAARTALDIREKVHSDLSFLLETTREALALDRLLYYALRNEVRSLEELLHFASHLRRYLVEQGDATRGRVESMKEICTEQSLAEQRLQSSNVLMSALYSLLCAEPGQDAAPLVRLHAELKGSIKELTEDVAEAFSQREMAIHHFKQSRRGLEEYIWDGSTKQPSCSDRSAAPMWHQLRGEIEKVDAMVLEASERFTAVKNGDKRGLRKLWQWFLTDETKLLSVINRAQPTV